jgi:6-phosphofructokinase 1
MIRGGSASALDRELAAAYGVAAVEALASGTAGSMLSFAPPKMEALPLAATLGGPRVVPLDGALIRAARGLGIVMEG